ncbi:hypothetical protein JAN5088_01880 [Jannaschia rubra]|uniref:Uncharacterized protein n=1 Tax=Jannaschia rubra TaxID=282197 RepID=A0A0M6XPM5_9RHOB|nr:hypothetical protein JAN5088_01880 [Jannaschia rubra]SFG74061.1 hypothetical protein SAMN04488517_11321 [Jannaschia rubra]
MAGGDDDAAGGEGLLYRGRKALGVTRRADHGMLQEDLRRRQRLAHDPMGLRAVERDAVRDAEPPGFCSRALQQGAVADEAKAGVGQVGRGGGEGAQRRQRRLLLDHAPDGDAGPRHFFARPEASRVDAGRNDVGVGVRQVLGSKLVDEKLADGDDAGELRDQGPVAAQAARLCQFFSGVPAAEVGETGDAQSLGRRNDFGHPAAHFRQDHFDFFIQKEAPQRSFAGSERHVTGAVDAQVPKPLRQRQQQRQAARPCRADVEDRLVVRVLTARCVRRDDAGVPAKEPFDVPIHEGLPGHRVRADEEGGSGVGHGGVLGHLHAGAARARAI